MKLLRKTIAAALRRCYTPGKFYRVPFGPNKGTFLEYDTTVNLDMLLGFHEPNTFEVARQLIRPGMVVLDLGANRGYFTVHFDKLVGPTGKVYAFEPIPPTFEVLKRTCQRNNCHSTSLVPKAATNKDASVTMFLSQCHYMSSLDSSWAGRDSGQITVEGVTVDSFFNGKGVTPDFIKMDIEGGGVFALPGMVETIKRSRPCMLLESHSPEEDHAIGQALSLIEYSVFRVGDPAPVRDLNKDYSDPYGIYGTVVGIPTDRTARFNGFRPELFQKMRLGQRQSRHS